MYRSSKAVVLLACAFYCAPQPGKAGDAIKLKLEATARQVCHVVRFPMGWLGPHHEGEPLPPYNLDRGYYEFRSSGAGDIFFVRGFIPILYDRYYTPNLYAIDLSESNGMPRPASEVEWSAAQSVPLPERPDRAAEYVRSLPFRFAASGDHRGGDDVSPGRSVLMLESWKGSLGCCGGDDVPGVFSPHIGIGRGPHGKLFFDAFSTRTGKKLVMVTAIFSGVLPELPFSKSGWVTGRYFFVPLNEKMTRCLVCDFGTSR